MKRNGERAKRSPGYRATAATRERVGALRAELATLSNTKWQRATSIMQEIANELGYVGGPQGGCIVPRSCSFCCMYGHSRRYCPDRIEWDRLALAREIEREREWLLSGRAEKEEPKGPKQDETFDEMGIAWVRDPHIGPTVAMEPGEGEGRYVCVSRGVFAHRELHG